MRPSETRIFDYACQRQLPIAYAILSLSVWYRIEYPHLSIEAPQCGFIGLIAKDRSSIICVSRARKVAVIQCVLEALDECLPRPLKGIVACALTQLVHSHVDEVNEPHRG